MSKHNFTPEQLEQIQESFDRTDKILAFKNELAQLINRHGIDSLLGVPDNILASVAVGQMEIASSISSVAVGNRGNAVLIS